MLLQFVSFCLQAIYNYLEDDSDEASDDGDERPLNPEELKMRVENQLKLGNTAAKKKPKSKLRK